MALGQNTKHFFETIREEKRRHLPVSMDEFSAQDISDAAKADFGKLTADLPDGVAEQDFIVASIACNDQELPIVTYTPEGYVQAEHSTVIFFYGGGFVCDLLRAHYAGIAVLAKAACCKVIAIDYPRAPDNTAKEITETVYAGVLALFSAAKMHNINPQKIHLVGFSAGGNLATVVTHKNNQAGSNKVPIQQLILLNPWLDVSLATHRNNAFVVQQAVDEMLTTQLLNAFSKYYAGNINPKTPYISPLYLQDDDLTQFPPTTLISAEYDALRGDAVAFLTRLQRANVPSTEVVCEGQTHSFFNARGVLNDGVDPAVIVADIVA